MLKNPLLFLLITVSLGMVTLSEAGEPRLSRTEDGRIVIDWSAVTELQGGDAIPANETIRYSVFIVNIYQDPGKTDPKLMAVTENLNAEIQVESHGYYLVGVEAQRIAANGTGLAKSGISWSNDPAWVKGPIFAWGYPYGLFPPGNLDKK